MTRLFALEFQVRAEHEDAGKPTRRRCRGRAASDFMRSRISFRPATFRREKQAPQVTSSPSVADAATR